MVLTALKTGTAYLSSYFIIPMRSGIVRDIRNYVYDKILTLPIGFFTTERKGDVMARMSGDVAEIENSVMASLDMMFKNPVLILVYLTAMIMISWQLTVFVFVLLPLAGIVMGRVGKRLKRTSYEGQTQWGVIMSTIEETLGGLRIIKAFNAEVKMGVRFHNENQLFYYLSNRVARRQSLAHPMSEFLGTTAIAIILWFGGSLILSGNTSLSAPDFIYYMVIFYSIINPAKGVLEGIVRDTERSCVDGARRQDTQCRQSYQIACSAGGAAHYHRTCGRELRQCIVQLRRACKRNQRREPRHSTRSHGGSCRTVRSGKSTMADLIPASTM